MIKVGVTGGIGSGKSVVCEIFRNLGVPIFNADTEAKKLLDSNEVIDFYNHEFGNLVFTDNKLNKQKIAALIFTNKDALAKVNNFIHPLVFKAFEDFCKNNELATYVIKEAALLFESEAYKELNNTILVSSPMELRIKRVIERDGISREAILMRINNQLPEENKKELANYIIENNEQTLLLPQVLRLHDIFTNK